MQTLGKHSELMYSTLIHKSNISSENLRIIEFEEIGSTSEFDRPITTLRGYFAKKEYKEQNVKYWIDEEVFPHLPIKAGNIVEELKHGEDVVIRPLKPTPFKIIPEKTMSVKQLIDGFVPFNHSHPDQWTLMKIVALSSFISRTYICIASKSSFGKTSIYDCLHFLTDKTPVFKPRSVPGVLNQITGNGCMVFDEVHMCKREILMVIEDFDLQIGGGKVIYFNGALKSAHTKSRYDCNGQSITHLYNTTDQYKNPGKEYFDFIFSNNKALDDRFLKLKFDGRLTEVFRKDFDVISVAEDNRGYYISFAKMLSYLQQTRITNKVVKQWIVNSNLQLKGRRRMVFDELLWLLDSYCSSQVEFDSFVKMLEETITTYRLMVNKVYQEVKLIEEAIGE